MAKWKHQPTVLRQNHYKWSRNKPNIFCKNGTAPSKKTWNSRGHTCIHTQMIYKPKRILVTSIFSSSWSCGRPDQKVNFKHWLESSGCSLLLSTFSWFHNTTSWNNIKGQDNQLKIVSSSLSANKSTLYCRMLTF